MTLIIIPIIAVIATIISYFWVRAIDKSIKVIEIQRQGKKPQNINEFVLGSRIIKGSRLTNA